MGLFSTKKKLGYVQVLLYENNEVLITGGGSTLTDEDTGQEYEYPDLMILFLFLFDRILGNLSKKVAREVINWIHELATQILQKSKEITDEEALKEFQANLASPNKWVYLEKLKSNPIFDAKGDFFQKGDRVFLETHFSLTPEVEASACLITEAYFYFLAKIWAFDNLSLLYFLTAIMAQCCYYEEEHPSPQQLGLAPLYGIQEAENVAAKYKEIEHKEIMKYLKNKKPPLP